MRTTAEIKAKLGKESIDYIKVGVFDMDGILRGKHIKKEKFFSAVVDARRRNTLACVMLAFL